MLKQSPTSFSVQTILNVPKTKPSAVKGGPHSEINLLTDRTPLEMLNRKEEL